MGVLGKIAFGAEVAVLFGGLTLQLMLAAVVYPFRRAFAALQTPPRPRLRARGLDVAADTV